MGTEDQRNLAVDLARGPTAKYALDPLDELDDFKVAGKDDKKRWFVAFMDRVLSRLELNVSRRLHQLLDRLRRNR